MEAKESKNKKQKILMIIYIVLAIILLALAIFLLFFQNKESSTSKDNPKNLKEITTGTETSLKTAFEQKAFYHFYEALDRDSSEENRPFAKTPIQLTELNLGEEYTSCTGNLNFSGTHLKKWDFQTSCEKDKKNMESTFISSETRDLEIMDFKKMKEGSIIATTSPSNILGFHYLDKDYNIVWEKYLTDSDPDKSSTPSIDLLETDDGFYAVGYLSDISGGDFEPYLNANKSFAYLAKFDFSGNMKTFLNLDTLASKEISEGIKFAGQKENQIIMITENQVLTLTDEKDLKVTKFSNQDFYLKEIYKDNYLAIKEDTITVKDSTEKVFNAVLMDQNGKEKWTIKPDSLASCEDTDCYIKQFVALSDSYAIVIENVVYIVDKDRKVIKTLDYTNLFYNKQEIETAGYTTVAPLDDSYLVITYPNTETIHIEKYNFKHKLISEKTYHSPNLFILRSNANDVKWNYQGKKFIMEFLFLDPLSSVAIVTLNES